MGLTTLVGKPQGYVPWTRPSDWSALPTLNVGDQKVVALVLVAQTAGLNLVSVQASGNYTVDWGDGSAVQNVNSAVITTHAYDFTTLSSGTLTSEGYRQAVMILTPQAGQTLTSVTFSNTPTGASASYIQPWRDMAVAGASIASLGLGSPAMNNLRWFTYVGPSALTSLTARFVNNFMLRGITGTAWTAGATDFSQMFNNCTNLESVPLFDMSSATSIFNMFSNCVRLRNVPQFNTSNATNFVQMFSGCSNLESIPLLDTSRATTLSGMFTSCARLQTVPLFVTTASTTFANMFQGCTSLQSVPALDTSNGTSFNSMFNNCPSLTSLPASFNTAKGTDFSNMFSGCTSLASHPAMTVSLGVLFTSMFSTCALLTTVNLPTSTTGTTFTGMLTGCGSLQSVTLNMAAATSVANSQLYAAGTIPSAISSLTLTGLRFIPSTGGSGTTLNQRMDAAAMNAFYTSLGTASGAQTLTMTGNPGSGSSTISIATGKGWTVTGG